MSSLKDSYAKYDGFLIYRIPQVSRKRQKIFHPVASTQTFHAVNDKPPKNNDTRSIDNAP